MKEIPENFTYNLKDPIKYHKDGLEEVGTTLTIKAPSQRNIQEVTVIDQEFSCASFEALPKFSALNDDKDSKSNKEEAKDLFNEQEQDNQASQMMMMLNVGKGDIMKCYNCLQIILTSGTRDKPTCSLDGIKLTTPMYDEIGLEDRKALLGLYIANFIYGSLLN